jgi:uncharacterized repeat protein (TIGR03803 family)
MTRRKNQLTTATAMLAVAVTLPAIAAPLPAANARVAAAPSAEPATSAAAATQPPIVSLYDFAGAYQCAGSCAPLGAGSANSLMQASDGNYYGATSSGGKYQYGVLFQLTPGGQYTDIHDFDFTPDGATVVTSLMEATDGNLYGVTDAGGAYYHGTIFQINLATGVFSTLFNFAHGGDSYSQLIDDGAGNLYGTTSYDGANGLGNLFSWNYQTGTYTDLYDFTDGQDGKLPWGGILIASDGRIYGTSRFGGPNDNTGLGDGVVWSIKTDGTDFEAIHDFGSGSTDGYSPVQGFVEGSDGALYSTTLYGGRSCSATQGMNGCGTLYKVLLSDASYTQVDAFNVGINQGTNPQHGAPTLGGDGNLYVIAPLGGVAGYGQLMEFTLGGAYTDIHDFGVYGASDTSGGPAAAVLEDQFGNLIGGDNGGGQNYGGEKDFNGEIYKIEAGIAPAVTLTASTATPYLKQPVQLAWNVTNAFSTSAKVCFGSSSDGSFTGLKSISGSLTVTPAAAGTSHYALTCGGTETAIADVQVAKELFTTTTITSVPSSLVYGQTGNVAVAVTSPSGKVSGKVALLMGGQTIGTASVSDGVAQIPLSTALLGAGKYSLEAAYEGDSVYGPSDSSAAQVTIAKAKPTIQFTITPATLTDGDPAVVIVSVADGAGTPGGSVALSVGSQVVTSVPLSSGEALFSLDSSSYPAGTYTVTATYEGDADDTTATATQTVTINKAATQTSLSIPGSVVAGNPISATATVSKLNLPNAPTGTVYLVADGQVIASGVLSHGQAVLQASTAGVAPGTYTVSAVYAGDAHSAGSSSPGKTVKVTQK